MKKQTVKTIRGRRAALLVLCLTFVLNAMLPLTARGGAGAENGSRRLV